MYKQVLLLCVFALPVLAVSAQGQGEYSIHIEDVVLHHNTNVATAEVGIEASLPPGDELLYIPLPFVLGSEGQVYVEQNTSNSLLLFGDLRPMHRYSVIQVGERKSETKLSIYFTDVHLDLTDSRLAGSSKVLLFPLRVAHAAVDTEVGDIAVPRLTEVTVESLDVKFSEPDGRRLGAATRYLIELSGEDPIPPDISYYIAGRRKSFFFSFVLPLALGFAGGLLGANRLSGRMEPKWVLFGAGALLLVGSILFAVFFSTIISLADNDILIAIGALIGVLFGLVVMSGYDLRISKARKESEDVAPVPAG